MVENGPAREDHLFYIDSHRENLLKFSCLNVEGLGPGYLACNFIKVALTCVQIIALGSKTALPKESHISHMVH